MAQIKADEKMANKPEKVIEGIVRAALKYFKETCLLEQQFVKDSITVAQYISPSQSRLALPLQYLPSIILGGASEERGQLR